MQANDGVAVDEVVAERADNVAGVETGAPTTSGSGVFRNVIAEITTAEEVVEVEAIAEATNPDRAAHHK